MQGNMIKVLDFYSIEFTELDRNRHSHMVILSINSFSSDNDIL